MGWNGVMEEVSGLKERAKGPNEGIKLGETTMRMKNFAIWYRH